ncbi:DUF4407 domain-containing protein [Flavobacterium johnsoniae]|jgi:hypothetical protein|uniref:DUF4407 domain-containing protein n=1 Tax=Flavobacterium johnsoniae (strain ATCC 17061 / DSM 2064 / JCM 8514 / BCRC 14874 / CCUG 350202 / NBRC 14942 / NCIMB 11054 / UW101) TaxID=376686 RepID=A5FAC7_FLAJ1|nr:DUF4407 domain-containing protein [Flavobacterium johnsoniae]ABQ07848.1 hypothetical protein Fjoh_4849 [Flavobacterium johnsoniae UW101]OXG01929.1 hypothetical protein B0A63_04525 [Flavobacterium johnsoniae UW101]WQG80308.1 DUF4407 domain-containing protein [Flavobacterium johnsoniae UW101]SHK99967.1 protein of unknown function [Flavobacterium johnsoniae]
MTREYYKLPESSAIMRFLWKCAGGDRYLLERATYSDQIKYMCLGGIVFATGALAGIAGGYAFYTIFEPRGSAIDNPIDLQTICIAFFFGIVWGLMIFNIDRFIVTSTGKGDGTEAITIGELKSALPRILMGMIIAMTISKPVEIRMFKTEIDIKLREKQLEQQAEYQKKVDKTYSDREKLLTAEFGTIAKERTALNERIKAAEQAYTDNLMGKGEKVPAGNGPLSRALKSQLDDLTNQLATFDKQNGKDLAELNKRKDILRIEKDKARADNTKIANGLDGLLERIKIAHEVAGFWISLFITLLFMAIELTPIFFKLMLTKTTYDYLAENRDELIKAEYGIEVKYDYYKDKQGVEKHLVINHEAEKLIFEKMKVTEIQKELTKYAVEKYKEREMSKIDNNLDAYINSIEKNEQSS